jgi:hypothetical protein
LPQPAIPCPDSLSGALPFIVLRIDADYWNA